MTCFLIRIRLVNKTFSYVLIYGKCMQIFSQLAFLTRFDLHFFNENFSLKSSIRKEIWTNLLQPTYSLLTSLNPCRSFRRINHHRSKPYFSPDQVNNHNPVNFLIISLLLMPNKCVVPSIYGWYGRSSCYNQGSLVRTYILGPTVY